MSKATACLLLVALCILIQVASAHAFNAGPDPSLVGWWKLDEGSGTTANDSSGNGNNGTINGTPTWVTAGKLGGALQFNGTNTYINVGNGTSLQMRDALTIAFWIKTSAFTTTWAAVISKGDGSWRMGRGTVASGGTGSTLHMGVSGTTVSGNAYFDGTKVVTDGEWHHGAGIYNGSTATIYVDGVQDAQITATGQLATATYDVLIGENQQSTGRYMTGMLDDVRVYNRALTVNELQVVMQGYTGSIATDPTPKDKATDLPRETNLSWTPGPLAGTHNVYLGTSFDDVNTASTGSPLLVSKGQDANSYDPPSRLDFGTTYYWRVDEVNASADQTVFKGDIWSFTTEPVAYPVTNITVTASSATATSPAISTINGSGLTGDLHGTDTKTMWLGTISASQPAWIQYDFDRAYKLHELWVWNHNTVFEFMLGFGAKSTMIEYSADGTTWTKLGDFEFAQAAGEDGYAHDTTVSFNGVAAKSVRITINSAWTNAKQTGLSEVRFLSIPVTAREPQPAIDATGIDPITAVFGWRSGREAVSHSVYTGTDPNAQTLSGTSTTNSFVPTNLSLGTKYYWRVDEVNTAEAISTWAGTVWSFTTADFVTVDNMESYNDTTNRVFDVWVDGYGTTTNGSVVGYGTAANETFNETTTIHGGKQSMPLAYGQSAAATSEATRTFSPAQDWTLADIKTLVLFFYGAPANGAASLYVKINNTKIAYTGEAGNLQRRRWNQWNIDLSAVAAATLKNVSSLVIGVSSSGTGTLYLDDIGLYKTAPAIPTPVDPGTTGLIAYYAMSSNVQDSSGKGNNGTVVGAPTYVTGLSASNMALKFNGTTDSVDLGKKDAFNPTGSFTVAFWANIGAWGTAWNHVMIGNRGEDNLGWQIRRHSSTSLCFTTRGVGNDDMASKVTPPQNEWIHIVCVYDNAANTKTIYINGLQDSVVTTTAGAKITATTHNTYIGARALAANTGPDTATFFTGMLDEIRIFNRALTAGEADFLSKP
jgi:hypothetical protein